MHRKRLGGREGGGKSKDNGKDKKLKKLTRWHVLEGAGGEDREEGT